MTETPTRHHQDLSTNRGPDGRRQRRARKNRRSSSTPLRGFLPIIVFLGVWQIFGDQRSAFFPPPNTWYRAVRPLTSDGELWTAIWTTFYSFIIGLVIAIVIGAWAGVAAGSSRRVDRATGPTFEFLRVLPAAALVPLAALLLGFTMTMKLVIVVLVTIWPILLACRSARRSMSPVLLDVPRTLRLSASERWRKVLAPSLIPSVLLGTRVAAPLALIITLLVEIVTSVNGLGSLLILAQAKFESAQVYGLLVIAGILGYVVNEVVTRAEVLARRRITGDTSDR
jgi:ABC-type nitrate/sulfonate/bicarbonate transport system permease component